MKCLICSRAFFGYFVITAFFSASAESQPNSASLQLETATNERDPVFFLFLLFSNELRRHTFYIVLYHDVAPVAWQFSQFWLTVIPSYPRRRYTYIHFVSEYVYCVFFVSLRQDWALQLKYVQMRDAGLYECQITMHPPTSIFIHLNVVGKLNIFFVFLHAFSLLFLFY